MALTILYGSETGTAEDVAFSMGSELKNILHEINILCMDDYEISRLSSERLIIFFVSTTGDGDAPINMKVCDYLYILLISINCHLNRIFGNFY